MTGADAGLLRAREAGAVRDSHRYRVTQGRAVSGCQRQGLGPCLRQAVCHTGRMEAGIMRLATTGFSTASSFSGGDFFNGKDREIIMGQIRHVEFNATKEVEKIKN